MRNALTSWAAMPLRCFIGTLVVFVVLNLPFRFAEFMPTTLGELNEFKPVPHHFSAEENGATFGGWPWRYLTRLSAMNSLDGRSATVSWSFPSLLANVSVALGGALLVAVAALRSAALAGGLVVAVLLGLLARGGYQSAADLAAANRLVASGTVYRSAIVPDWLPRFISSYGLQAFARTRGVMLHRPDATAIQTATGLPALRSLGVWKAFPTNEQLRPLMLHPRLRQLAIYDAQLEDSVAAFIATQDKLRHLELIGCRGLAGGLVELAGRIQLRSFDATGSDFPISVLSASPWGQALRRLKLSHPESGTARLELRNYHQLQSLRICTPGRSLNADVLTLSLKTVPKLQVLKLGSTQKIALDIVDARRLREVAIEESEEQLSGIVRSSGPVNLWLERLRLIETPNLRKLECFAMDLQKIEIVAAPSLIRLAINSTLYAGDEAQAPRSDQDNLSGLIADLSVCEGPPIIDLSTMPLQNVDLTPLTNNKRIRELRLAGTGIDGVQLKAILALPRLKALDIRYCPISCAEVGEVLASQPQLRQLLVDGQNFREVKIIDRRQLVKFTSAPIPHASVVRISGSSHLDAELLLGNCLTELSIRDGGSLQGLSIDGPVPPDATLQGLRDLKFCALGGATVDDRLCGSIWRCLKLGHLTLAHTNVSRQAIANIRDLTQLNTLILPGCDIDDSITSTWDNLNQLREIDLSHTGISTATLELILSRPNLQRLAINYVNLQPADLRELAEVAQLIELEVAGIGLEERTLRALVGRGMLDRLDLSGCRLSREAVRILASDEADSLTFLGLANCGLSEAEIRSIVDAGPRVAVDIHGNPVSDAFRRELGDANRLLSRSDRTGFLRRIALEGRSAQPTSGGVAPAMIADTTRGRINVHQFALAETVTASR